MERKVVTFLLTTFLLAVLLSLLIFLTACTKSTKECSTPNDCIPNQCCHPTNCVKHYDRVCNMMCTQECVPNTLDCGQGHCDCIDGKCTATFG